MPQQVFKTDLQHLQVSDNVDILMVIRTSAETWSETHEETAVKAHDGIGKFLSDCVKHKKVVYQLIKDQKQFDEDIQEPR